MTNLKSNTRRITVSLLVYSLLQLFIADEVSATNQEPVNFGFIFSLPWDVSNTLRAPLAGPISIVLTAILACALVFSLLAAPVWYIFGYPKRRYFLHDVPTDPTGRSMMMTSPIHQNFSPELFSFLQGNSSFLGVSESSRNSTELNLAAKDPSASADEEKPINYPDFHESMFMLIPEIEMGCKKLMVCHAHGFLSIMSDSVLSIYRFFSKKLLNVPIEFKEAIRSGLLDQSTCMVQYHSECSMDIVTIAKLTVYNLIPEDVRESWQIRPQ